MRGSPAEVSGRRTERLVVVLLATFGAVFALVLPPCQAPDEHGHFLRAYSVSEGHFVPRQKVAGWGADDLPKSVTAFLSYVRFIGRSDLKVTEADLGANRVPLDPADREVHVFGAVGAYPFVPYLPQAIGIAVARWGHLDALTAFYAGRLANLAASVSLIWLAVRIVPAFKLTFGVLALLPMAVQQIASHSPDSITIALTFLLTALLLRMAIGDDPVKPAWVVAAWILTVVLAFSKPPYALVAVFYLAVPAERLGSRLRYLVVGGALAVLLVASMAASARFTKEYSPDTMEVDGWLVPGRFTRSLSGQVEAIKADPQRLVEACVATTIDHGARWIEMLSRLGWGEAAINPLAAQVYLWFVVVAVVLDQASGPVLSVRLKWAAALAASLGFGMVLTSAYIGFSAVGGRVIEGIQGRYLLPLLPMAALTLSLRGIRVQADPRLLRLVILMGSTAMLGLAVAVLVRRYYLAEEAEWLAPTRTVSVVTLLMVVAAAAGSARALHRAGRDEHHVLGG